MVVFSKEHDESLEIFTKHFQVIEKTQVEYNILTVQYLAQSNHLQSKRQNLGVTIGQKQIYNYLTSWNLTQRIL